MIIPELQKRIDEIIKLLLPVESNEWIIYEKCKEAMRDYEIKNRAWFTPQEWREYIVYIIDKLDPWL